MTALTTILGLVPLALALNEGAQLQQPMAIAVIGGLAVSTFLSLIIIPTIYLGLEDIIEFLKNKMHSDQSEEQDNEYKDKPLIKEPKGILSNKPEPAESAPLKAEPEEPIVGDIPDITKDIEKRAEGPSDDISKKSTEIEYEDDLGREKEPPVKKYRSTNEGRYIDLPKSPDESEVTRRKGEDVIELPQLPDDDKDRDVPKPANRKKEIKPLKDPAITSSDDTRKGQASPNIKKGLASRHKDLISYLKENNRITRKEYSDKFSVSVPTAARDLKLLLEKGIIIAKGPAAIGRYYILNEEI